MIRQSAVMPSQRVARPLYLFEEHGFNRFVDSDSIIVTDAGTYVSKEGLSLAHPLGAFTIKVWKRVDDNAVILDISGSEDVWDLTDPWVYGEDDFESFSNYGYKVDEIQW